MVDVAFRPSRWRSLIGNAVTQSALRLMPHGQPIELRSEDFG
jgi:hypothetical protein